LTTLPLKQSIDLHIFLAAATIANGLKLSPQVHKNLFKRPRTENSKADPVNLTGILRLCQGMPKQETGKTETRIPN